MEMKKIFCFSILLLASHLSAFTAFENDRWQADIILPDTPDQAEAFAAKELQYHLGKVTGTVPEILPEGKKSVMPYHFYIGAVTAAKKIGIEKKALLPDDHILKTVPDGLLFIGGDRDGLRVGHQWSAACQGTLYAVYDYLEKEMGVRWLWPGELGEMIPQKKKIEIGEIYRAGSEPLICRRMRPVHCNSKILTGWKKTENRTAFYKAQELFLIRHRMGAKENRYYGHAFSDYWQRFGKTHPDFFALLPNGKREPLSGDVQGQFITMCVSNPAFQDQVIHDWVLSRRGANPHYQPAVNACENDTPGMCVCAACRAWDAEDPLFASSKYWGKGEDPLTKKGRFHRLARVFWGEEGDEAKTPESPPPCISDRYAKFYMALLKKAKTIDPDARVAGYAYANYSAPPRETKLDKDVILIYVPGIGFPYSDEASTVFRSDWLGWRNSGISDIMLRPNYMLSGANLPVNFGPVIVDDFSFAARNGMTGTNFDSLTGAFANQGAMLYSLIRAHRAPSFGYENAIREYCSAFAPAEDEIRAYVDFWDKFSRKMTRKQVMDAGERNPDCSGSVSGGHSNFFLLAHELYPPEVFDRANAILDKAADRAAGYEIALKRIEYLRKGLRDAELTCKTGSSYSKWRSAIRYAAEMEAEFRQRRYRRMWQGNAGSPGNAALLLSWPLEKRDMHPYLEIIRWSRQFQEDFERMIKYRADVEADFICNFGYFAELEQHFGNWPHASRKIPEGGKNAN